MLPKYISLFSSFLDSGIMEYFFYYMIPLAFIASIPCIVRLILRSR